jgi:hypothetical protein
MGVYVEAAVEGCVLRAQRGQPLDDAQRAQLGEGEVVDEPSGPWSALHGSRGPAVGELRAARDVRRARELRVVPGHQHAVGGRDEVGFEVVGAEPGGERVGRDLVLRPVAGRAPVSDDEGPGHGVEGRCEVRRGGGASVSGT